MPADQKDTGGSLLREDATKVRLPAPLRGNPLSPKLRRVRRRDKMARASFAKVLRRPSLRAYIRFCETNPLFFKGILDVSAYE